MLFCGGSFDNYLEFARSIKSEQREKARPTHGKSEDQVAAVVLDAPGRRLRRSDPTQDHLGAIHA